MIDAQAVLAHLETLRNLASDGGREQRSAGLAWLLGELQQLSLAHHRDAGGNDWISLPGMSERTVVLGSSLKSTPGNDRLDSRLGVVTGLETVKALALRYEGRPPCTVRLVVWADPDTAQTAGALPAASAFAEGNVAAYLELHIEPAGVLAQAGTPLGVVTAASAAEVVPFNPRLMALCDEAIRELTGASASLASGPAPHAAEMARLGVPSAVMYVQSLTAPAGEALPNATRLHLLQAAEAFGRWTESTMHLVAGEEVDLWAREHRVPHTA